MEFLDLTDKFLHHRVDYLPFKYKGLPIGVNSRKEGTWYPLVQAVTKRLAYLKNMFVSLGWKAIMLNLVLNSLLIFFHF